MTLLPEAGLRALCKLDDIPDGGTRGFEALDERAAGLFAVRQGGRLYVYVNRCPHIGTPLHFMTDRFLSASRERIVCATHGAEFAIEDGRCVRGPCLGDRLEPVMIEVRDGVILVPHDAGL